MKFLFIGNSYTYYHDLPGTFAAICLANGHEIEVDSVTKGGYSINNYLDESDTFGRRLAIKLKTEKYDAVVIQEQSIRAAAEPERYFTAIKELVRRIRLTQPEIKLYIYATWARRDGNGVLAENGWTHDTMLKKLRDSFESIAEELGGEVVYAGDAMHEAYRGAAGDTVYAPDGSHPSEDGTKLVAKVFYDKIFG